MSSPTADRITAQLVDEAWQPSRADIEAARDALVTNAETIDEQEDEIERLRELCDESARECIRLRAPQAGMIYAAANYAGLHGELTVAQFETVARALNNSGGISWHSMCEQLAPQLGVEFANAEKPKRFAKAAADKST